MILPILLFAAVLVLLGLLVIVLLSLVIGSLAGSLIGGILAGAEASRRPKLGNGWRTAIVLFGTVTGGALGAIGLTAAVLALLYFGAG